MHTFVAPACYLSVPRVVDLRFCKDYNPNMIFCCIQIQYVGTCDFYPFDRDWGILGGKMTLHVESCNSGCWANLQQ